MFEYCSVTYSCIARGWTQEISWVRVDRREIKDWYDKPWTDYLNYMAQQKWELVSTHSLAEDAGNSVAVAYFKRSI